MLSLCASIALIPSKCYWFDGTGGGGETIVVPGRGDKLKLLVFQSIIVVTIRWRIMATLGYWARIWRWRRNIIYHMLLLWEILLWMFWVSVWGWLRRFSRWAIFRIVACYSLLLFFWERIPLRSGISPISRGGGRSIPLWFIETLILPIFPIFISVSLVSLTFLLVHESILFSEK